MYEVYPGQQQSRNLIFSDLSVDWDGKGAVVCNTVSIHAIDNKSPRRQYGRWHRNKDTHTHVVLRCVCVCVCTCFPTLMMKAKFKRFFLTRWEGIASAGRLAAAVTPGVTPGPSHEKKRVEKKKKNSETARWLKIVRLRGPHEWKEERKKKKKSKREMNVQERLHAAGAAGAGAKAPFPSLARVTGAGATLRLHAPGYRPVHQSSFLSNYYLNSSIWFFPSANLIHLNIKTWKRDELAASEVRIDRKLPCCGCLYTNCCILF